MTRATQLALVAFASLALLAGCGQSGHADLDAWMKEQGDEGLKTERALPDPRPKKKENP